MSSSIVHFWSIIYQTSSYFNGSYMAISNLTLIHGLIFFPFCRFIPIVQIRHIWIKVQNSSPQKPLNQITPNFTEKVLVWSSLNIVSNISTLYSTWRPFKKMNLFVYVCIFISQDHLISYIQLNYNELLIISSKFSYELYSFLTTDLYRLCIFLENKDHIKIFYPEIWAEMIFVWLTFKILFDTTTLYPPSKMAGINYC
jgi:hypothetical protein